MSAKSMEEMGAEENSWKTNSLYNLYFLYLQLMTFTKNIVLPPLLLIVWSYHYWKPAANSHVLVQTLVDILFFYIYYYPWGARRSTFWRYHNLNSVRHRKSTNHPSCTCTCSACSFNIGLALLLGIRSLDPRPRARTAPALAWCRRQLGSQTSCSAKSRSQYSVLNI